MPQGVPRLNQQRYAEVVRLLKKYISNEAVNEEKRIKAIETPDTIGVFMRLSGNDVNKARAAALAKGWKVQ